MAIEVSEFAATGCRFSIAEGSITRNFWVQDTGGDTVDLDTAISQPGIPPISSMHPSLPWGCTELNADYPDKDTRSIVHVEANYKSPRPYGAPDKFTRFSVSPQLEYAPIWKKNATTPQNGVVNSETTIDGDGAVGGADPITEAVITAQIRITYEEAGWPNLNYYFAQTGLRNSEIFMGFEVGSLLYVGPSVEQIDEVSTGNAGDEAVPLFEWTHVMHYDSRLHCRQYLSKFSLVGGVMIDDDGFTSGIGWMQPFPNMFAFSNLGIPT